MLCFPGVSLFPISLGIFLAATFVTTYIIAVLNGDVEALFPYISDTGVAIPERVIFSQFLNMAAFLALITMFLRYKLINGITQGTDQRITRLSKICMTLAVFSSLGLTLVANFQESVYEAVHLTGAGLVFLGGVLYSMLDSCITYNMYPTYNGKYICRTRLTLAIFGLISFCITFGAAVISLESWYTADIAPDHSLRHWTPDDPGYIPHLVSTFGEWSLAVSFLLYYFTFIRDFQKMTIEIVPRIPVSHLDEIVYGSSSGGPTESTTLLA